MKQIDLKKFAGHFKKKGECVVPPYEVLLVNSKGQIIGVETDYNFNHKQK